MEVFLLLCFESKTASSLSLFDECLDPARIHTVINQGSHESHVLVLQLGQRTQCEGWLVIGAVAVLGRTWQGENVWVITNDGICHPCCFHPQTTVLGDVSNQLVASEFGAAICEVFQDLLI